LNYNHQDTHLVTSEDALKAKAWFGSDQVDFEMSRTASYPVYFDRNFEFMRDRNFYFGLLLFGFTLMYATKRWDVEKNRAQRTERIGNIENLQGHHFSNRGGVLIEK